MKTLSSKALVTKMAMVAITLAGLALAACKPENIILTNTGLENALRTAVQETCPQRADGTCKAIGE